MSDPTRNTVRTILRRDGRSLFQYLREVPPWAGLRDQDAVFRMREMAGAELVEFETLARLMQKRHGETAQLGSFPDFTPYNDAAVHFLLPTVIREQKQLLQELERDRRHINDPEIGVILDRLLELKRRHVPDLEALQTSPHTFTTVNV